MRLRSPRDWEPHRHPLDIRHLGAERTIGERIADGVAGAVGSWPFILVRSSVLALWVLANALLIRDWLGGRPFDPYPFSC